MGVNGARLASAALEYVSFLCFLPEVWTEEIDLLLIWNLHLEYIYQKEPGVEVTKMLLLPNQHEAHFTMTNSISITYNRLRNHLF